MQTVTYEAHRLANHFVVRGVCSPEMAPRFRKGDVLTVALVYPLEVGQDYLMLYIGGRTIVRTLVAFDDDTLTLEAISPEVRRMVVDRDDLVAVFVVTEVSRGSIYARDFSEWRRAA